MGKAISSADLDSDHKLRNDKLSKLIETPSTKTDGKKGAKDSNTSAKDSTETSATPEGGQ